MHIVIRFHDFPPDSNHTCGRNEFGAQERDTEMKQKMRKCIPRDQEIGSCFLIFRWNFLVFIERFAFFFVESDFVVVSACDFKPFLHQWKLLIFLWNRNNGFIAPIRHHVFCQSKKHANQQCNNQ